MFYPLAAESETDMEDWITVLSKAIGLDTEDPGTAVCGYHYTDSSSMNMMLLSVHTGYKGERKAWNCWELNTGRSLELPVL